MHYLGGKSGIAKDIAMIINKKISGGVTFVSLFCGALSVESQIVGASRMILNDKHKYLIAMLRAVQNGYDLPEKITEEEYNDIKANRDRDIVLSGFVGFACSFGGKWLDTYAKDREGKVNYALRNKKSLLRKMATLKNAEFVNADYRDVIIPPQSIIYADPPYENTVGYTVGKFDSTEFWEYMRQLTREGHTVFVSEQNAPDDFKCVWEKQVSRSINYHGDKRTHKTEKLFMIVDK